jgi:hypothetical protein
MEKKQYSALRADRDGRCSYRSRRFGSWLEFLGLLFLGKLHVSGFLGRKEIPQRLFTNVADLQCLFGNATSASIDDSGRRDLKRFEQPRAGAALVNSSSPLRPISCSSELSIVTEPPQLF